MTTKTYRTDLSARASYTVEVEASTPLEALALIASGNYTIVTESESFIDEQEVEVVEDSETGERFFFEPVTLR